MRQWLTGPEPVIDGQKSTEYEFSGREAREMLEQTAVEQLQAEEREIIEEYITEPLGEVAVEAS